MFPRYMCCCLGAHGVHETRQHWHKIGGIRQTLSRRTSSVQPRAVNWRVYTDCRRRSEAHLRLSPDATPRSRNRPGLINLPNTTSQLHQYKLSDEQACHLFRYYLCGYSHLAGFIKGSSRISNHVTTLVSLPTAPSGRTADRG